MKKRIELIVALSVLTIGAIFGVFALSEQTKRALNEAEVFEKPADFFKDIESEDDVVYNKRGEYYYVKNQVMLYSKNGVSFEAIQKLANEYNGTVVGYFGNVDKYQIEIDRDVTLEELYQIIAELKENSKVRYASVNHASEPGEDGRQSYFKDIESKDDIAYDGHGIYFVKNQFHIMANDGVSYEEVEELANEYDGVIVGYFESIDDYQIEITHDVTTEELYQIIAELKENPDVRHVSVNHVFEVNYN